MGAWLGWARLVETVLAITNHFMKNPHMRKQKWVSDYDWKFPKLCFRLKRQFQATVSAFFKSGY